MVDWQAVFADGGKIGTALREIDWPATPLGHPEKWSEALRGSLNLILNADYPMMIWWGDEFTQFYNNALEKAAQPFLQRTGLGASGAKLWEEIFENIEDDIKLVAAGKGCVRRERQLVRNPAMKPIHLYWTYSLSPIADRGKVGGVLFVCQNEKSREAELIRVHHIGRFGGLEVDLTAGFRNCRSPEYLAIHGLPPEARNETHENWVQRIHQEDRYRTEHTFIEAVGGNCKGYSIRYRILRPSDGKTRWILAKTEIERDPAGRAMRLVGVHADITDEVDVLKEHNARLTAALNLFSCAVLLVDANGFILHKNRSAETLLNEGAFVRSRHNMIRPARQAASRDLAAALRLAACTGTRFGNGGWIVKLSGDDERPVIAHVLPLAATEYQVGPGQSPVTAIFIRDRDDTNENARLLAATHDLTIAESRLLSSILTGRSLSEAAAELNVAGSTVKTQLKSIFRKTGVSRQPELILLASRLAVPVVGRCLMPRTAMLSLLERHSGHESVK